MLAQGICEDKFLEIKNIFNNLLETKQETGAAFSVIQNKKKIISIFGGSKNSKNEPWNQNTIVNTFSTSKGVYEACIAKLLNENLIDIEQPVFYYWPNFKKNNNLPLQNIPVSIKDLIHLKGTICTSGSLVFKNRISLASATIVNRLINAGSQIIGKNNLVEFAYGSWGTNNFFGTPVNPRDKKLKRVCGGSSSG